MTLKKYKKVYLEITNRCNLSCDFCIKNQRKIEDLSMTNFQMILEKVKAYTNYLYFHILGEPLLHPNINDFINIASKDFQINITTNGYFIETIQNNPNIRQVNISLHSFHPKYHLSLEEYLKKVLDAVDKLIANNTYISLRLWIENPYSKEIITYLNKRYHCQINFSRSIFKIQDHLFIHKSTEFIWPDLGNDYYNEIGECYGLRDHFGILVDGTIVPCCLDTKGIISLGNIYQDNLETVLTSKRCEKMRQGFRNHQKIEELCKHCSFLKEK